jgi:hypothetical protein
MASSPTSPRHSAAGSPAWASSRYLRLDEPPRAASARLATDLAALLAVLPAALAVLPAAFAVAPAAFASPLAFLAVLPADLFVDPALFLAALR